MKKTLKISLISLLVLVSLVLTLSVGYIVYFVGSYSRLDDNIYLTVLDNKKDKVSLDTAYTIITYNIGFGAYTPEYSFFMDGGKYGRAESKESVENTVSGIKALLFERNADFIMLEEVDQYADRSYKVDQKALFEQELDTYASVYAQNYDSPYVAIPFNSPHGSAKAGMMTLSKFEISSSLRRKLPVENTLMKYFDLDRCYTVTRIPTENGKELVLYTVHLSAYTSDEKIKDAQLLMVLEDMKSEYEKGNYIICGGDFNKDLLIDSTEYFKGREKKDWAAPIDKELIESKGFILKAPTDNASVEPTCRNPDKPYHEKQFVVTVDGFIVSDNISVEYVIVADADFEFSDHNPVEMKFTLKS